MSKIHRSFRLRYGKKFKSRTNIKKIIAAFVLLLAAGAAGFCCYFEYRVSLFMENYSEVKAKQMMSELISDTVNEKIAQLHLSCEDLTALSYSANGEIQQVNTDVMSLNKLKNEVTSAIAKDLDDEYVYYVDIPLGSFFDSEFLSGSGRKLRFNNSVTGDVRTDFRSEFETGGINQTVHRLYIDITGELIVIACGSKEPFEFTDSVLVGETVIVGNVPSTLY